MDSRIAQCSYALLVGADCVRDVHTMASVKLAVQAMVSDKRAITAEEANAAMKDLFAGSASQALTGAFLTSLQVSLVVSGDQLCVAACRRRGCNL